MPQDITVTAIAVNVVTERFNKIKNSTKEVYKTDAILCRTSPKHNIETATMQAIQEVREWLRENFLLLNDKKTEVVIFGRTPLRSNGKLVNRLLAADLLLQV